MSDDSLREGWHELQVDALGSGRNGRSGARYVEASGAVLRSTVVGYAGVAWRRTIMLDGASAKAAPSRIKEMLEAIYRMPFEPEMMRLTLPQSGVVYANVYKQPTRDGREISIVSFSAETGDWSRRQPAPPPIGMPRQNVTPPPVRVVERKPVAPAAPDARKLYYRDLDFDDEEKK